MDFMKTLNDFQKFLGNINWLRPSLGVPTYALQNLFKTLERPSDLNSSRHLTSEAKQKLKLVKKNILLKPSFVVLDLIFQFFNMFFPLLDLLLLLYHKKKPLH